MNNLYEALEVCLSEIEQGADVNVVLSRYPELTDELRPILESSAKAKEMAAPAPSQEIIKKNRAKLLQHAAEMRERKAAPSSRRIWSVPLRRALVSLIVVTMLFVSSTGLVRASSNTLPGDNLYPVKRTWEDVLVFFTFNTDSRDALELEHENERLDELHELFAEGRSANVDFAGYITRQNGTEWRVAGITILITPETRLPNQTIDVGTAVRIVGKVEGDVVVAERIELLAPGSIVPEIEDNDENELEVEGDETEGVNRPTTEVPVTGSVPEEPVVPVIKNPTPKFHSEDVSLEGVVSSIENNFVVVNGVVMDIQFAEIEGVPSVGAPVKIEGYYGSDGVFIVTNIEFIMNNSNSGGESDDGNVLNANANANANDNDNDNDDDHSNDNGDHVDDD